MFLSGNDHNTNLIDGVFISKQTFKDTYLKKKAVESGIRLGSLASGISSATYISSPVQYYNNSWKSISLGSEHCFGIDMQGNLLGWGYNQNGCLGTNNYHGGSSYDYYTSPIRTIASGTDWKKVSCGHYYTAAIKEDGTLWMWGLNDNGQLGLNHRTSKSSPTQIGNATTWSQISCGINTVASVKSDGTLWTWGNNTYGQLGDGTVIHKSSPIQIGVETIWGSVSSGASFVLAVKSNDTLWSWGNNNYGVLGINSTVNKSSPTQVGLINDWDKIDAGYYHAAAIKNDGSLWTWGQNLAGQLGDNTVITRSSPVQTIMGGTTWSQVSSGSNETLAIKADGSLWGWGINSYGSLGIGTVIAKSSPVQIGTLVNWLAVETMNNTTIGLKI